MKYGAIYYKDTDNIGDDIQTYVALRFLPKLDYLVEREKLDSFIPKKDEKVKVICNGFFHHDKMNFPFSPYIEPLYISMHFTKNDPYYNIGYKHLEGYGLNSFKNHKIGCRDHDTLKLLKEKELDAYFSGCMTTTLQKFDNIEKKDYICAVDLKDDLVDHIKAKTKSEVMEITHWLVPSEISKIDFDTRMKNVENLLKVYQGAKLVVTDRLHVALPCLALGTPVILVYYDYNSDRLGTFKDYVYAITEEEFLTSSYDFDDPKENNTKYLDFKNELEKTIEEFIKKDVIEDKFCDVDFYKNYIIDKCEYHKNIAKEVYDELKDMILEHGDIDKNINYPIYDIKRILSDQKEKTMKLEEIKEKFDEAKKDNQKYKEDLKDLKDLFEKLENSRTTKLLNNISKNVVKTNNEIKEILNNRKN